MKNLRISELGPRLILGLLLVLRCVAILSLATLAGYLIIGGIGGTIAMLAGAKEIAEFLPAAGWVVGLQMGVGGEIERLRRMKSKPDWDPTKQKKENDESSDSSDNYRLKFRVPYLVGFFKALGLGTLFGAVLGIATTVFLSLVLFSVTTSPFVPNSWRAQARAPDAEQRQRDRQMGNNRDGVSSEFSHPLLAPIALYSLSTFSLLGFVAGGVFAFFEDDSEAQGTSAESAKDSIGR